MVSTLEPMVPQPLFSRLRIRLFASIALLVIPILLAFLSVAAVYRTSLVEQVQNNALQLTQRLAAQQQQSIETGRQFLLLVSNLDVMKTQDWDSCTAFVREVYPLYQDIYSNIGLVDPEGLVRCSVSPTATLVDVSEQLWFSQAMNEEQFIIGGYTRSRVNNRVLLPMAIPVYDETRALKGILAVGLTIESLNETLRQTPLPDGAVLTMTDHLGTILARQTGTAEQIDQSIGTAFEDAQLLAEITRQGEGVVEWTMQDQPSLIGYASLGEGNSRLHVILSVPEGVAFAPAITLERRSLLVFGIVISLALLFGIIGSNMLITSGVERLVTATRALASGNLNTRIDDLSSIYEFQVLASNFNHMVKTVQQRDADLRLSEQKFREIFDHAFQFMALLDLKGRVLEMNAPGLGFNNLGVSQSIGQDFTELSGWQRDEGFLERLQTAIERAARGEFVRYEERVHNPEIPISVVDFSLKPILDAHGKVTHLLAEGRDITEVKQTQEALNAANLEIIIQQQARQAAEKADQLKLHFLAMISHELRTPLTSIKGFATTLLAEDLDWTPEQVRSFAAIISEEADKLKEMVEQLLDLSSLEAGMLRIQREPTTLETILDGIQPQLTSLTTHHPLIMQVTPGLPQVLVDADRIGQVIMNLISNAVKYSPPGSEIVLSTGTEGLDLCVQVDDQGLGIPAQERESVFQAFRRLAREDSGRVKGAGLGLSICRGLIAAHGGQIEIVDKTAPGTRIRFTLPFIVSPELPKVP